MEIDFRINNCLSYGHEHGKYDDAQIRCGVCGRGIYSGEDYYNFFDEVVCSDCEFDYVLKKFHKYL